MRRTHLLKSDFIRLTHRWQFYAAFLAGLVLILHPLTDYWPYRAGYSAMQLLSGPLAASDFTPFAAIFCVLPFGESFCEDLNSGYISSITQRTGVKQYAWKRCLSTAISGGMVAAAIMLATILICVAGTGQPDTEETVSFMSNGPWARMGIILVANGAVLYALRAFTAFLFGMLWALVGLLVSVIIPNRYVTLVAPFALYQILWLLLGETAINPVYMFRGDSNLIPSFWFLLVYQLCCILLCGGLSYAGMKRRLTL